MTPKTRNRPESMIDTVAMARVCGQVGAPARASLCSKARPQTGPQTRSQTRPQTRALITAALLALMSTTWAAPARAMDDLPGDVAKGEKVFKKCKACHAVGADAKNKTGPQLNGILGRAAGTVDGFKYSKALMAAAEAGLTWTVEDLDAFLQKPKAFLKGTKMSFAGLKRENQRQDVIKFLSTHKNDTGS